MTPAARSRILSLALAAFLLAAPAENFAGSEIKIDAVAGLTLSGYDKEDALKWTISADAAELDKAHRADNVDAIRDGQWNVRGLKVKTFSDGNDEVVITSATAVFFPRERRAEGKELVEVKDLAKRFYVKGIGWFWKCDKASDVNSIAVTDGVSVELYDAKALGDERDAKAVKVSAQRLDIALTDRETVFTFSSRDRTRVKLTQGDIVTYCDKLEVVIPQNAHEMDEASHGGDNSTTSGNSLQRIKKISGQNNVEIFHGGRRIKGDSVELIPEENRFLVTGGVEFNDPASKLNIRGEKSVGLFHSEGKKLSLESVNIEGKNGEAIRVTTQSLESQKNASGTALFTGKKLSVRFPQADQTTICLEGDVELTDSTLTLNCDKLEADASRAVQSAEGNHRLAAVREIRAEGKVKAVQDGRICECESVKIDTEKELTLLSGNPRMYVPAQHFSLTGEHCEIDRKNELLRVFGGADKPVRAELQNKNSASNTRLESEFLEVTRDKNQAQHIVFDLSGKVRLSNPGEQLDGSCDRLRCFYKPDKTQKNKGTLASLQKIEALGNVELQKEATRISGGKALMFNNIVVSEWMRSDDDGSDGKNPMLIKVLPGDEFAAGGRPQIRFPKSATGKRFSLPLPGTESARQENRADREILVEGDTLETIIGERRLRFWLRDQVVFSMDDTTCTCGEFEAELRRRDSKAAFEAESIFARKDVKIARKDAYAAGKQLEIFPKKQIGFLSGNAHMFSEQFGKTVPGKAAGDRFILDLAKSEIRMETDPKLLEGTPAQVARPRTVLPKNIRDEFSLKLKNNTKNRKK